MTKTKMTNKALKERYFYELRQKKVFAIGYCTLQSLLHFHSPDFYTAGGYGWNYDSYYINGYVINTGYRGMFGYSVDYDLSRDYDLQAEKIIYDNSIGYEKQRELVNNLLMEYLQKATLQA